MFDGKVQWLNGTDTLLSISSEVPDSKVLVSTQDEGSYFDVSLMFVRPSALYAEESLIADIQSCLRPVLRADSKKSLVLLVLGDSKLVQQRVAYLLREAYQLSEERDAYREKDLLAELDVKVLLLRTTSVSAEAMDPAVLRTVQNVVRKVAAASERTLEAVLSPDVQTVVVAPPTLTRASATPLTTPLPDHRELRGYEESHEAAEAAVEWARLRINEAIKELQLPERAPEFAGFVDNLAVGAAALYTDQIAAAEVAPTVQKQGLAEIQRRVVGYMYQFFRFQCQLARRAASEQFAQLLAEDEALVYSVDLQARLRSLARTAERNYTTAVDRLLPACVRAVHPRGWSGDADLLLLREYIAAYEQELVAQARVRGVLPRGRWPVAVSFHTLLLHPLGRDYRQDVIGDEARGDVISYDPSVTLERLRAVAVSPSRARAELKRAAQLRPGDRELASKAEFAREMLMLPLAVKNPGVPLMLGRSKKKTGPPKPSDKPGPERFIDWSLPQLERARRAVREANGAPGASPWFRLQRQFNQVFKNVPYFGSGVYDHPLIAYDHKYGPYSPSSSRGKSQIKTKL